jgi:hypothetical protein
MEESMTATELRTADRPAAFLLTGAFRVICRNHAYLATLAARGLHVLVITPEDSRQQAQSVLARAGAVADGIADIAYVHGAMEKESSYNPDVMTVVQEWSRRYRIVGAYAMEEALVEPTGLVCDALGLPGLGLRASRASRSKYLQRCYLGRFSPQSLTVPPHRRGTVDLTVLKHPVVVKPAARHGSSGVMRCADPAETAELLATYPAHETVLVEQEVFGQEYSVESLVQGGAVVFSSVTHKETTSTHDRTFVELAHTVPAGCHGTDLGVAVGEADREVIAALAVENGITHSEWRVTDTGEPYLMEIAARTPGDGLTALYELACGQMLEPEIIRIALGEQVRYPAPRRYARQVYLEHQPGWLRDVTVSWPGVELVWLGDADLWPAFRPGRTDDPPTLRVVLVHAAKGSRLHRLRSSFDRAVSFFIDASTAAELDELERRVRDVITVHVDDRRDGGGHVD